MGQVTPPAMPSISAQDELQLFDAETTKRQVLHCDLTLDKIKEDARQLNRFKNEAAESSKNSKVRQLSNGFERQLIHTHTASNVSSNGMMNNIGKDRPCSAVIAGEGSVINNVDIGIVKAESLSYVSVTSIMKPQVSAFRSIDTKQRSKKSIVNQTPLREDDDEVRIEEDGPVVTFEESPPR